MSKTANLLVDGYARPDRVGLLLPLHWQTVCFLLGAAAAGSAAVVARTAGELSGCPLAFVSPDGAEAALDAGVDDVLVASGHPLGARLPSVPPMCVDAALEVPAYGDRYAGPFSPGATVLLGGASFAAPDLGLEATDRVLTTLPPATPEGLGVLLAALAAGAGLVLVPHHPAGSREGDGDLVAIAAAERVTVTAGAAVPGVREVGQTPGFTQEG